MSTPKVLLIDQLRVIHCTAARKRAAASSSTRRVQDDPQLTLTLIRGIHVLETMGRAPNEGVDGRVKPGHSGLKMHHFLSTTKFAELDSCKSNPGIRMRRRQLWFPASAGTTVKLAIPDSQLGLRT